jgi:endonuclease/exonuclease/phosphatase family metal-dependent hydrolase
MKVMTFNIQHCLNYLENKIDFEIMARAIMECGADVVGLNEVRDLGSDDEYQAQAEILAKLCGMEHYYFAKAYEFPGGPYGNAILSRIPIVKAETIAIPDPEPRGYDGYYEPRCILKAELADGITVMVLHVGLNPDEKESAVATVLSELTDEKCVLMGDFNMTPDNPLIKKIADKLVDTAGVFDKEKFSFPSDNANIKIDYIFVSNDIKVKFADIVDDICSDHKAYICEIDF